MLMVFLTISHLGARIPLVRLHFCCQEKRVGPRIFLVPFVFLGNRVRYWQSFAHERGTKL